jgi:hypothetical protein
MLDDLDRRTARLGKGSIEAGTQLLEPGLAVKRLLAAAVGPCQDRRAIHRGKLILAHRGCT